MLFYTNQDNILEDLQLEKTVNGIKEIQNIFRLFFILFFTSNGKGCWVLHHF